MWLIRTSDESFDPYDVYDNHPFLFTIKMNHGGIFTKYPNRKYINGKHAFIDYVDAEEFSVHDINAMMQELGYIEAQLMYYHFKMPDLGLDFGLKALGNDHDVLELIKYIPRYKLIDVYIEHWRTLLKTYFKSPVKNNVSIEELSPDVPTASASCKKALYLGFVETVEAELNVEDVWNEENLILNETMVDEQRFQEHDPQLVTGRSHNDVLLNNLCEVFNKQLVDGRDKPIITALEYIREYLMKKIANVSKVIQKADGLLTPNATVLFDAIKKEASQYVVLWNGGQKYQVSGPWSDQCVVDVNKKECSCRRWELTGIPCKHAVATIWYMACNGAEVGLPEIWVHPCYWLDTWKAMYSYKIDPINGKSMWIPSDCPTTISPSVHHTQIGRPKKKRRKAMDEEVVKRAKLTRIGKTVTCNKCKKKGHNSRTCKGQLL